MKEKCIVLEENTILHLGELRIGDMVAFDLKGNIGDACPFMRLAYVIDFNESENTIDLVECATDKFVQRALHDLTEVSLRRMFKILYVPTNKKILPKLYQIRDGYERTH